MEILPAGQCRWWYLFFILSSSCILCVCFFFLLLFPLSRDYSVASRSNAGKPLLLWHWEMRFWCVSQALPLSSRVFERKSYFKRRVEKSGDLKGNSFWRHSELDIWRDMGMRFNRTFLLDLVICVSAPTIYLQLPVKKIKKRKIKMLSSNYNSRSNVIKISS